MQTVGFRLAWSHSGTEVNTSTLKTIFAALFTHKVSKWLSATLAKGKRIEKIVPVMKLIQNIHIQNVINKSITELFSWVMIIVYLRQIVQVFVSYSAQTVSRWLNHSGWGVTPPATVMTGGVTNHLLWFCLIWPIFHSTKTSHDSIPYFFFPFEKK